MAQYSTRLFRISFQPTVQLTSDMTDMNVKLMEMAVSSFKIDLQLTDFFQVICGEVKDIVDISMNRFAGWNVVHHEDTEGNEIKNVHQHHQHKHDSCCRLQHRP